jgi:hypothetical protein
VCFALPVFSEQRKVRNDRGNARERCPLYMEWGLLSGTHRMIGYACQWCPLWCGMGDSDEIMDRMWAEWGGLFGGPHRMIGYVREQSPLCMEWGDSDNITDRIYAEFVTKGTWEIFLVYLEGNFHPCISPTQKRGSYA